MLGLTHFTGNFSSNSHPAHRYCCKWLTREDAVSNHPKPWRKVGRSGSKEVCLWVSTYPSMWTFSKSLESDWGPCHNQICGLPETRYNGICSSQHFTAHIFFFFCVGFRIILKKIPPLFHRSMRTKSYCSPILWSTGFIPFRRDGEKNTMRTVWSYMVRRHHGLQAPRPGGLSSPWSDSF